MVSVPLVLPVTSFTTELSFASRTVTSLDLALGFGVKLTTIELGETSDTDGAPGVANVSVTVMTGDFARLVSAPVDVDFSVAAQVCAPTLCVATAPGPLAPRAP